MMTVSLNNHQLSIPLATNLQEALQMGAHLDPAVDLSHVAAVVNQNIVPKSEWQQHLCQPNDQIELFSAVAGG
ncbi:sulfur carrier protein ThiS [Paraglaciecola sp.]|uniref:sulfur carrier protein ThiS n=1 Tax=Paraglaciecola sp. TaxID=1920173 RepID=UPI0030F38B1B